jgi:hypothetical protein
MPFMGIAPVKEVIKMSLNICRASMIEANHTTISKGILCTTDSDLYIWMLTSPC